MFVVSGGFALSRSRCERRGWVMGLEMGGGGGGGMGLVVDCVF